MLLALVRRSHREAIVAIAGREQVVFAEDADAFLERIPSFAGRGVVCVESWPAWATESAHTQLHGSPGFRLGLWLTLTPVTLPKLVTLVSLPRVSQVLVAHRVAGGTSARLPSDVASAFARLVSELPRKLTGITLAAGVHLSALADIGGILADSDPVLSQESSGDCQPYS